MKAYKISIILFVLILIALSTGSAVASPIVDPVRLHCPRLYPDGFYYVYSNNVTSQQTNEAWQYGDPRCMILPPSPIMWA